MTRSPIVAVLVALLATAAHADDKKTQVPEMERLAKLYVGTWDYVESYPKSPSFPSGGQNTGVYTSELGPGGNSLVNRFHSKGPVGDFEGLMIMTWDRREKAYKAYLFGNDFPGAVVETGQWEGDAIVLRGEFLAGSSNIKVAVKHSARMAGGKLISEETMSVAGAPEKVVVSVEATRRP